MGRKEIKLELTPGEMKLARAWCRRNHRGMEVLMHRAIGAAYKELVRDGRIKKGRFR